MSSRCFDPYGSTTPRLSHASSLQHRRSDGVGTSTDRPVTSCFRTAFTTTSEYQRLEIPSTEGFSDIKSTKVPRGLM